MKISPFVQTMDIEQWFTSIPVVTRLFLVAALVTAVAVTFDVVQPVQLCLIRSSILDHGQWWRLITTFLFFDRLSINFMFHAHMVYMYCSKLEEHVFFNRTGEFAFFLLRGAAMLLLVAKFYSIPLLSYSFTFFVMYVWSRKFSEENLLLYGMFVVSAANLPYVLLGISLSLGGWDSAIVDIAGLAVGHVSWYLMEIVPCITGFDPTMPPRIIRRFLFQDA